MVDLILYCDSQRSFKTSPSAAVHQPPQINCKRGTFEESVFVFVFFSQHQVILVCIFVENELDTVNSS